MFSSWGFTLNLHLPKILRTKTLSIALYSHSPTKSKHNIHIHNEINLTDSTLCMLGKSKCFVQLHIENKTIVGFLERWGALTSCSPKSFGINRFCLNELQKYGFAPHGVLLRNCKGAYLHNMESYDSPRAAHMSHSN